MEIVGVLRNARRVAKGEDPRAPCLSGEVYGDVKGRFSDGERVTTSTIMSEEGDVFWTRFSVYRVESWAPDADGWIEWNGGDCPVEDGTKVDVKWRGGIIRTDCYAWGDCPDLNSPLDKMSAGWAFWFHDGLSGDIVAYRLSKDEGK